MREELGLNRAAARAVRRVPRPTPPRSSSVARSAPAATSAPSWSTNFAPTIELSLVGAGHRARDRPTGRHPGRHSTAAPPIEYVTMIVSLVGISMPVFWIGLMLIYWLGARAGWFPLSGTVSTTVDDPDRHPLLHGRRAALRRLRRLRRRRLAPGAAGDHAEHGHHGDRLAHGALEHARGAQQRLPDDGPREGPARAARSCCGHALKNALIPVVTVVGLQLGALLSGAVLTETVFGRVGVGPLRRDGDHRARLPGRPGRR